MLFQEDRKYWKMHFHFACVLQVKRREGAATALVRRLDRKGYHWGIMCMACCQEGLAAGVWCICLLGHSLTEAEWFSVFSLWAKTLGKSPGWSLKLYGGARLWGFLFGKEEHRVLRRLLWKWQAQDVKVRMEVWWWEKLREDEQCEGVVLGKDPTTVEEWMSAGRYGMKGWMDECREAIKDGMMMEEHKEMHCSDSRMYTSRWRDGSMMQGCVDGWKMDHYLWLYGKHTALYFFKHVVLSTCYIIWTAGGAISVGSERSIMLMWSRAFQNKSVFFLCSCLHCSTVCLLLAWGWQQIQQRMEGWWKNRIRCIKVVVYDAFMRKQLIHTYCMCLCFVKFALSLHPKAIHWWSLSGRPRSGQDNLHDILSVVISLVHFMKVTFM